MLWIGLECKNLLQNFSHWTIKMRSRLNYIWLVIKFLPWNIWIPNLVSLGQTVLRNKKLSSLHCPHCQRVTRFAPATQICKQDKQLSPLKITASLHQHWPHYITHYHYPRSDDITSWIRGKLALEMHLLQ